MSLRILADENMPDLETFARHGRLETLPGRAMTREQVARADVLLVRSVTRVDAALLAGTPVRFVGSATIGTDHVDTAWLAEQGIPFYHAPGCNAAAVAEYVLQAVLVWALEQGRAPVQLSAAVVGCGNVGRRVAALFEYLGMRVRVCDPPRERAGEALPGEAVSLAGALEADVISLHVPLTRAGPDPTFHLLEADGLERLGPSQLLVNTSRGPVIDNQALCARLEAGGPATVLDVWEGEPVIDPALFHHCLLGTPHIAGYSVEGKRRGTAMLYRAFCEWLGEEPAQASVEPPEQWLAQAPDTPAALLALLRERYDMRRDHEALAGSLRETEPGEAFDRLRREYPARHESAALWALLSAG